MKTENRRQKAEVEKRLASLLAYPSKKLARSADDTPEIVDFFHEIEHVSSDGLEELFTRTFDLNPVATLDLGWHLFGEQYERGRFLAKLRELEEQAGIAEGNELPDHLTLVLQLLPSMEPHDAERLAARIAPAIEMIRKKLDEQGNPYRHLVRAAELLVASGGER